MWMYNGKFAKSCREKDENAAMNRDFFRLLVLQLNAAAL